MSGQEEGEEMRFFGKEKPEEVLFLAHLLFNSKV